MTSNFIQSSLRRGVGLLLVSLQLGCQPSTPRVSKQGQEICFQEAAAVGLGSAAAARRQKQCLSTIDQRLKHEKAEQAKNTQIAAQPKSSAPPVSPDRRYIHCINHQEEVQAANNLVSSTLGPWMYANAKLSPVDPEYTKAKADYEQAYANLEKLIPSDMRAGLPLIPDAARLFTTCERESFFPK